ncbi:FAD-binding oxidoreductase [Gephyromycinifex aptenodytis]|uniref:FAD-binding oxidoreductase n=1 Tax=Gephyromycinifex aptenodytis TaxID=2716227 RepID=UPI00144795A9|nr:FAD-binding oxidoreductase [Gephyromycinifex aptenodytis]
MDTLLTTSIPRSVWYGWGDPAQHRPLPPAAWEHLRDRLGAEPLPEPLRHAKIEDVELPDSRLPEAAHAALCEVVGEEHVAVDRASRIEHAGGKAYPDLYRLFHGDAAHAPDAVVLPGNAQEVAALLQVCAQHRVAVVPFGGGTSVVGGVEPLRGQCEAVINIDLRRLDQMLACDPISRVATFQPGMRGPDIERALQAHDLTLGHYPQSHQEATLGGYVATRSAGQASTGYGRPDERLLGARVATPTGEIVLSSRSPASAAGPRLLDVVAGSEGTLGIITEATLSVSPMPTNKRHAAWLFGSFAAGSAALRAMVQDLDRGTIADVCRLSDVEETQINLSLAGRGGQALLRYARLRGLDSPCVLILVFEGRDEALLKSREKACAKVIKAAGGVHAPAQIAKGWEKGRFSGPYLRDALMTHRVLADTLETATTWTNIASLHQRVSDAIRTALQSEGDRAAVMCHISHVYGAGASLYFTFSAPEGSDALARWQAVKDAAGKAIIDGGGTITHHHAVGADLRPWLSAEIGEGGARMLRALKDEFDPTGILNPGKTIPSATPDTP